MYPFDAHAGKKPGRADEHVIGRFGMAACGGAKT
jgi:hypothetical protein